MRPVAPLAALLVTCALHACGRDGAAAPAIEAQPDCATAPEPSSSVVYFCDCQDGSQAGCQPGDDGNPGTKALPRRTWSAARTAFGGLPAGGTLALCKGGAWSSASGGYWNDARCTASSPCTIREYQAEWGGSSRPLIVNAGAESPLFLGNSGSHQDAGYRVWNLALRGDRAAAGVAFWDVVSDSDLCNLEVSNFQIGVYPAGGPSGGPGQGYIQHRITLRHSWIHDNGNFATEAGTAGDGWLGSCDACTIDSNLFENNGVSSPGFQGYMFQHQIYLSGANGFTGSEFPNQRVINNRLWTHGVQCAGVRFVVHGGQSGLLFENNLIQNDADLVGDSGACWGFGIGPGGYGCPISYTAPVIRRNRILGLAGNTPLSIEATSGALIEDNVVELSVNGTAIEIPGHAQTGCYPANTGTTVRNNTVHILSTAPSSTGILLSNEGTGHVHANNVVYSSATGATCARIEASVAYDGSNWCGSASPFVDAAAGDYRPAVGGPLDGAADAAYASPYAITTATWSASDPLVARPAPPDLGAGSN